MMTNFRRKLKYIYFLSREFHLDAVLTCLVNNRVCVLYCEFDSLNLNNAVIRGDKTQARLMARRVQEYDPPANIHAQHTYVNVGYKLVLGFSS